MLLNYEGEDLDDDDLDGSIETSIFKEVFFGYDHDINDNRGLLSETSQEESYYAIEGLMDDDAHWCSLEGEGLYFKCSNDGKKKRMKLPTDELSYSGHYSLGSLPKSGPSKRILSGISLPTPAAVSDYVSCQLVESCSQGITSSCFFIKRPAENDVREVDTSKTICSSISQESSANKLLVASPVVNVASNFAPHRSVEKTVKSSDFHNMPVTKAACNMDSTNNLKPFLRCHVQDLLRDAGWEIGRRKRENIMGEFLYYTPWRRKPIRDFRRVWNLCGRKLFADAEVFLEESNKQWADMTHLWSDLTCTILEFEREMNCKKSAASLAQRWYLLDPFVNMVFIDKKLDTLKAGKSVKARRSLVIGTFEDDVLLPSDYVHIYGNQLDEASEDPLCVASVANRNALTYNMEEAGTWWKESFGNKRNKQSIVFSKACGMDSTYVYSDSCLFDVPITYEDENIICAGSEIAPPSHDHNNLSPSFCRSRSNFDEDVDLEAKQQNAIVCFETGKTFHGLRNENVGHQFENNYLVDIDIKVMQDLDLVEQVDEQFDGLSASDSKDASFLPGPSFKRGVVSEKLKKTFGNRLITLDQNTPVPRNCKPEWPDIKRESIFLEQSGAEGRCKAASACNTKCCGQSFVRSSDKFAGTKQDVKLEKSDFHNERLQMHPTWQLKGDNVWFSAIRKSKSFRPSTKGYDWKIKSSKSEARKKHKSKKESCRLVPRSSNKGNRHIDTESPVLNVRTVLSWLIDRGIISLGEDIHCRNIKDDTVLKDGMITRDGIFCKCCGMLLSVSKFRSHAGHRLNHPCLDLFMKFCKSFTTCQLEAWSAEYKARESATQPVNEYGLDPSDDKCGLCGNMGELICCDNCPSTFHRTCLETQELPEGSWYCMHCSCRVCGDLVDDKAHLKAHTALVCLQCEHKYHMACLQKRGRLVLTDDRFCCQSCQEMYTGLNSRIGFVHQLSDGFSCSLLKCTHDDLRNNSAAKVVASEAECNSKLAVALTIMEECFLSIVDSRTGIDMIPHVLYNWRSEYPRLNYNGFYTLVLENDDMLLSVASLRIHGVAVAEMPLVATCSTYQRQGMFRRLLHSIEEMLKCFKVEKLVVSALPSLIETWTVSFGFTLMEDDERNTLRNFNLMVFPGTVWLKKHICISSKPLQGNAGVGHIPSSVTNSPTERACFCIEPKKQSFGRSATNESNNEREIRQSDSKKMQMDQNEHGILYKHLLKLPWGEPDSSSGRIRIDVRAARESVLRMSQKSHTLQDTC